MYKIIFVLFLSLAFINADETDNTEFFDDILNNIKQTSNSDLPDDIKLQKIQQYVSKLKLEKKDNKKEKSLYDIEAFKFNLMSHKDNFLLFGGYSSSDLIQKHWNPDGTRDYSKDYKRNSNEAQFQISLKVPLVMNMFDTSADLYVAYTQNSYWQVYDGEHSRPFREIYLQRCIY